MSAVSLPREPRYPSLYQINTRAWLTRLSRRLGRHATLDDVPDAELDRIAARGLDWVWLLSVWTTGNAGREASRTNRTWRSEFEATMPDLTDDDIGGSGFAVTAYDVADSLGGNAALARLRERLRRRGLRLMLDFVPNHVGLDHPWLGRHPDWFVAADEEQYEREPHNYHTVGFVSWGVQRLAHGRDPYFPGWSDTLQLDYSKPPLQAAMRRELLTIAARCDGVRCDMAMLILPEVFERTWGRRPPDFWPDAIALVRRNFPEFRFLAEVYWDLEWTLQRNGFDFTYDKRLYDRLRYGGAGAIRDHLAAGLEFQSRSARFLENHDEPRAAATFPLDRHRAAAAITFLTPGLRFFQEGQFEGRRVRISTHLIRDPDEPVDAAVQSLYDRLLPIVHGGAPRDGDWRLLPCGPAWDGNPTHDDFVAFTWEAATRGDTFHATGAASNRLFVAVNFTDHRSQCRTRLPFSQLAGRRWRLCDLFGGADYERDGDELCGPGLFLDLAPWEVNVFALEPIQCATHAMVADAASLGGRYA